MQSEKMKMERSKVGTTQKSTDGLTIARACQPSVVATRHVVATISNRHSIKIIIFSRMFKQYVELINTHSIKAN